MGIVANCSLFGLEHYQYQDYVWVLSVYADGSVSLELSSIVRIRVIFEQSFFIE